MKTALKASLLTALTFVLFLSARSQTTANHNVTMALSDVLVMTLNSATDVEMQFLNPTHYTDGVESATRTLTVSSNKTYKITCYATSGAPTSGDLTTGTLHIPYTALSIRPGSGSYVTMSNS